MLGAALHARHLGQGAQWNCHPPFLWGKSQWSLKVLCFSVLKEYLILLANSMTWARNLIGFNSGGYKALPHALNLWVPFTKAPLFAPRRCLEKASEKCHTHSTNRSPHPLLSLTLHVFNSCFHTHHVPTAHLHTLLPWGPMHVPIPTSLINSFSSFLCAWIPKPFHLACAWNPSIYHPSPPCPCKPMIPTSIPTFHKVPCTRTLYHLCHHHAFYLHIHSLHTHQNFSHPFPTLPIILSKTTSVHHLSYLPHFSFATKPLTPHPSLSI